MCTGLTLRQAFPRRPGVVGRRERLHHHALVAGGERLVEQRAARRPDRRCAPPGCGAAPRSRPSPSRRAVERLVDEVAAVDVEDVEPRRVAARSGPARFGGRRCSAESWNACGSPSSVTPMTSPSRTTRLDRQRAELVDDRRHAVGDVVEVAGVEAHLVAEPVRLDAHAVELPLDRRRPGGGQRLADVGARSTASIGWTAMPTARCTRSSAPAPSRARAGRWPGGRRSASRRGARASPARRRRVATASAISPASAPWRSSPVRSRRTNSASSSVSRAPSVVEQVRPPPLRARAGARLEAVERVVELADLDRRARRRSRRSSPRSPRRRRCGPAGARR